MEASNIQQSNPSEGNNKMDTITMARQEREKNGPWEAEISYGGDSDLHRHLVGCEKNPGHLNFVPVHLFGEDLLPSGCQDNLLVEMIQAVSDLTVRMSVKYVSENRPETFPGSDKPYPCYRNWKSGMMRFGTGWVWDVEIFPNKDNNPTCGCKDCLNSLTPKIQFARIYIHTAAHVVWDDLEGADTTCHLFFDRGDIPEDCDGVIALSGMSEVGSSIDGDWCVMVHVTHDLDLAHRLHKMVDHRRNLVVKVRARNGPRGYPSPRYNKEETGSEPYRLQNLAVIVSHPHGCSKQVSVGYWTGDDGWGDGDRELTYTTATCPGSSGARVYVVGDAVGYNYHDHVHSGNCEENKELNFCSWTWSQRLI